MTETIDEIEGLRGAGRGGSHNRSLEVVDDSVEIGAEGAGWKQEEYTDKSGQKRIRQTRRT